MGAFASRGAGAAERCAGTARGATWSGAPGACSWSGEIFTVWILRGAAGVPGPAGALGAAAGGGEGGAAWVAIPGAIIGGGGAEIGAAGDGCGVTATSIGCSGGG